MPLELELSRSEKQTQLAEQEQATQSAQLLALQAARQQSDAEIERLLDDLSGSHEFGKSHNYGLAQQVELQHLTDAFASETLSELVRAMYATGLLGVRQYALNTSFDNENRRHHNVFSAINLHDHSNYKSMPGLGELMMVANGYYYRSRHNDYIMRKSVQGTADEFATDALNAPEIKASVLAKPTGVAGDTVDTTSDTQARYLKNIYTDNPEDVEVHLAYAEVWREISTSEIQDAGESFRHADAVSDRLTAFTDGTQFSADGVKDLTEDYVFPPTDPASVSGQGVPTVAYTNFRIMCAKVGTLADIGGQIQAPTVIIATSDSHFHIPTQQMTDQQANDLVNGVISVVTLTSTDVFHAHNYDITWNGSEFVGVDTGVSGHVHEVLIEQGFTGNVPFDPVKAADGIVDSSNRFSLVEERWGGSHDRYSVMGTRWPRFSVADLERMCERVPGMDGEGAFIAKTNPVYPEVVYEDRDGGELNAAYYHRAYSRAANDAAGRQSEHAGFNDPNLFVAKNTKNNVVNRVSYLIPLELVLRSPVENWNPYSVPASATRTGVENLGGNGSQSSPYQAYSDEHYYYLIPYGFYADTNPNTDPADTSGSRWMKSGLDGQPRRCWGSGIKPFTADGIQRIRIPIYPVAQDYSAEGVKINQMRAAMRQVRSINFDPSTATISTTAQALADLIGLMSDIGGGV